MTKIGMITSRTDPDAALADHFRTAKWLVVVEPPDRCEFVRKRGLDGRSVAEELAALGCTDVVVRNIGQGAYARLTASGVKVWQSDADERVTPRIVAERLASGAFRPLAPGEARLEHVHRPGKHGLH